LITLMHGYSHEDWHGTDYELPEDDTLMEKHVAGV